MEGKPLKPIKNRIMSRILQIKENKQTQELTELGLDLKSLVKNVNTTNKYYLGTGKVQGETVDVYEEPTLTEYATEPDYDMEVGDYKSTIRQIYNKITTGDNAMEMTIYEGVGEDGKVRHVSFITKSTKYPDCSKAIQHLANIENEGVKEGDEVYISVFQSNIDETKKYTSLQTVKQHEEFLAKIANEFTIEDYNKMLEAVQAVGGTEIKAKPCTILSVEDFVSKKSGQVGMIIKAQYNNPVVPGKNIATNIIMKEFDEYNKINKWNYYFNVLGKSDGTITIKTGKDGKVHANINWVGTVKVPLSF